MVVKYDVIIVGGGMTGSVLALALAQQNFRVALMLREDAALSSVTPRVSAINIASQNILKNLSVFNKINSSAMGSLQRLLVWDEIGGAEIEFDSADMALPELGSIVENHALLEALQQGLAQQKSVTRYREVVNRVDRHHQEVNLLLQNGETLCASLIVGADGAFSWLRQQFALPVEERSYDHSALIASVSVEKPHQQTGWQVFLPTGPLAFLPLADSRRCSIVWSNDTVRAKELMSMDVSDFEVELNNAFGPRLGYIRDISPPVDFPLVMRHACRYVESRVALVGDAAHTIHPLAGQGLNLGLLDAAALVDCLLDARNHQRDIGGLRDLMHYQRWRKTHNRQMLLAMRFFRDLFCDKAPLKVQLRNQGLSFVNRLRGVKSQLMKVAIGRQADLPGLAITDQDHNVAKGMANKLSPKAVP